MKQQQQCSKIFK